jgi:poly-beta-1,6-N-acetyl-D-glucosamine synthase
MEVTDISYVLVTPARNEEASIEKTIRSVTSQTVLPKKWVIVSDGSTDRTDEIVGRYLQGHPWMELLRMPERRDRNFAAKAHCFNAGYSAVKDVKYDIIGNLDADITFDRDYLEFRLHKFREFPDLGVAGTPFVEGDSHYDYRFTNIEHVSGACQLFRRECFEQIGGYLPIKGGGIDWTAVTTARMKGWRTRTFTEKVCFHHRKMGTGDSSLLKASFRHGKKDYCCGNHPLWQFARTLYQMSKRPYVIGGAWLYAGYLWGFLSRAPKAANPDLIAFCRSEQMQRLRGKMLFRPNRNQAENGFA